MNWHPKSIVALILGITVLAFVLFSGVIRLVVVPEAPQLDKSTIEAWKEILVTIVGGLLVWIGGQDDRS